MEPFLALPRYLVDAPACRALSPAERAIMIAVLHGYNGRNNGEIRFAAREGEAWGLGKSQTAAALRSLVDAGFLQVSRPGAFTTKRLATLYALTWRPADVGERTTRAFLETKASPAGRTHRPEARTVAWSEPVRRVA